METNVCQISNTLIHQGANMRTINVLDQGTINQIAAGEVVERPCSVVKELVENAIDAKSGAITVEIRDGGLDLIRVSDNGSGIGTDDVKVAFLRHSTSKLKSAEDLPSITSLGFRGEALSSISSVAKVELLTKTRSSFTGTRYVIDGGEEKELAEIGCPEGTTFCIKELFYNVPARRKFLKSAMTEASYITELMERLAISNPNVSFKYINNNKTILQTSGNGNLKDIIYHVYGRDIAGNVLELSSNLFSIDIDGYIGKPVVSRGNRNHENYFVNGRYVRSNIITRAIEEAYKPYSMKHKYPFTVLNITLDGQLIDVNVHPTKMELRFQHEEDMYRAIYQGVAGTLSGKNMIPNVTIGYGNIPDRSGNVPDRSGSLPHKPTMSKDDVRNMVKNGREREITEMGKSTFMDDDIGAIGIRDVKYEDARKGNDITEALLPKEDAALLLKEDFTQVDLLKDIAVNNTDTVIGKGNHDDDILINLSKYPIIGQVFSTYWLVEGDDELLFVDQHAAHEKILYEELIESMEKGESFSQSINPPIIVTLTPGEIVTLARHGNFLENIGFSIEHFGGKEYALGAVPTNTYDVDGKEILISLLDDLSEGVDDTPEIILKKVASMSCKAAIKGNQSITAVEAREMLNKLSRLKNPFNCPHGRPIIISMSKYEIEKKFKRIV